MRRLSQNISLVLKNECGGPNVEQIIGISVALAVGSGLFFLGKYMYQWLARKDGAAGTVEGMYAGNASDFTPKE